MSKKSESAEQHIKSVKRRTRRKYSAEEKIREAISVPLSEVNVGFLVCPAEVAPLGANILTHLAAHADTNDDGQIPQVGWDAVRDIVI